MAMLGLLAALSRPEEVPIGMAGINALLGTGIVYLLFLASRGLRRFIQGPAEPKPFIDIPAPADTGESGDSAPGL